MYSHESILPVVQIVVSLANVKIEYADGIYFLHFGVEVSQFDMFCDGFGYTEEDTFQIVYFPCVLHFHDDDFVLAVPCLDVHTVEFVVFLLLVAFAFQYFNDADRLVQ